MELTVPGMLADHASARGAEQFMVCGDLVLTYAELDERSRRLAQGLLASGIGKGDRVALVMPNGVDWAALAFAVMRIGAVLVPLSTLLRPPELLAHLRASSAAALVTVHSFRGHQYVRDLEREVPGLFTSARVRAVELPVLRHAWVWEEDPPAQEAPGVPVPEPDVRPADDRAESRSRARR